MKQLKRALAGLVLAAALLTGSVFAVVPAAPEGSCVLDEANVLSERTEQAVNDLTIALSESCGAEIGVLTVDFTGTSSTADYAIETLNSWGVGDPDKNNGVLLLLVIGAEDYYCTVGTGLEKDLPPQKIDDLLWNNLEEGFAKGDYDAGVTAFTNAMYDELCDIYDVQPGQSTGGGSPAPAPEGPSFAARVGGFFTLTILLVVLIFLVVLGNILHPVRYVRTRWFGYTYPPLPPRRHFYGGWYRRPPPPPRPPRPPHSGGPGGFGGFGGGSSRPSSSSRPKSFGGFSGGSGRGSGAGRRSGGGSPRSGGSRSGGGAGRRR
ncbi:MAG TPA: TPM domain-containing protein [Candidatus Fournierella pullicola]|uniref:TPM domain-containing protein n=1 Tax=Candidatus Allofournierella pullicola TaxID=2838596 RepID=A0A9D2AEM3_9FIRM|nr:TPM domain-containing protein [Candidatus Fournierella pullicola]